MFPNFDGPVRQGVLTTVSIAGIKKNAVTLPFTPKPLVSAGIRWYLLVSAGIRWYPLVSTGIRWLLMDLLEDVPSIAINHHCHSLP